jgi:hypothetical protein
MALAPALVVVLGLVSLFAVGGYWLMRPTVFANPGVAAYQAPTTTAKVTTAKIMDPGSDAKRMAAEAAATATADRENRKLGLAANASVTPKSSDGRVAEGPAPPRQPRVQKRQDKPDPRVAQRPLFGWGFGLF